MEDNKTYYQNNKEKWNKKTLCQYCNCYYSPNTKFYHMKSKKHTNNKELYDKCEELNKKLNETNKELCELKSKC